MKIVLTGSSSGIGKFLADNLTENGHNVCRLSRSPQPGFAMRCDVSNWAEISTCASHLAQQWDFIDGIICCAGIQGPIGLAMETEPVQWKKTLAINLDGTFFALRAFYPLLCRAPRRAKIICLSGGGSTSPRPNFAAYAVSKTGVLRLVETLAAEWRQKPIDINAIAPGAVFTRMIKEVLIAGPERSGQKEIDQANKLSRDNTATLKRALELIKFLLSENSDGITGRLISAPWDPWLRLQEYKDELAESDIFTLRRIIPEDRGKKWS
ncbi:MAG TPA: SDR family oxidoreductase [Methylomirabilota bacterium]|nr:SDR family oxidoreductase [Methylomirabilota bacterium]